MKVIRNAAAMSGALRNFRIISSLLTQLIHWSGPNSRNRSGETTLGNAREGRRPLPGGFTFRALLPVPLFLFAAAAFLYLGQQPLDVCLDPGIGNGFRGGFLTRRGRGLSTGSELLALEWLDGSRSSSSESVVCCVSAPERRQSERPIVGAPTDQKE